MFKIRKTIVHGRPRWRLEAGTVDGVRRRMFFASRKEAEAERARRRQERDLFGTLVGELPPRQRGLIADALQRLKAAGATLTEAVDYFLEHRHRQELPLAEAVKECLTAKAAAGKRPRYLSSLRSTLLRFTAGRERRPTHSISAAEIETWLAANGWAPATRRSYVTDLRTLFAWCEARGYTDANPAAAVEKPALEDRPPGIFTPEQVKHLLAVTRHVEPRLVPYVALGLFAGLRPVEAQGLTWLNVGKAFVEVTAAKSKTRRRRLVTVTKTLRAWLKLGGDLPPVNWKRRLARVRKASGLPWPHDVLRHSFASYHLARWKSPDRTAHELGHGSTQMLFAHYRELVTPGAARVFWSLVPEKVKKIRSGILS